MVASAMVMARRPEGMRKLAPSADWQSDAWTFYDQVGELRFGAGWLANGLSRVNLVAARQPEHLGDEPSAIVLPDPNQEPDPETVPLTLAERLAVDLVSAIAGGADGQGQLLAACAIQLSIPGIGFILMTPEKVVASSEVEVPQPTGLVPVVDAMAEPEYPAPDESWEWRVLAQEELRSEGSTYQVATGQGEWEPLPDEAVLVKVWRPHPRRSWEPDSPCRAVLGILRQIVLLDEHVMATAQSRLAGAGLLILPSEAEFAPLPRTGTVAPLPIPVPGEPSTEDDFVEVLVDTMTIPIGDRGSAAAVVPLVVRIPGEYADKPRHITFWSEFSGSLLPLRDNAVRRLALGLDMPPEVLTGMSDVNHWTAWQVEETAITLHIEPMAETVVHALTIGYLRPALEAAGVRPEDADGLMVWYDTTDLTVRPDRSQDAVAVYDRYELSAAALRRETGLSEDDAPSTDEKRDRILLSLLQGQLGPTALASLPWLSDGREPANPAPPGPPEPTELPPAEPSEGELLPVEAVTAGAVLEACDGLVHRALERAGGRLKGAAGRGVNGGSAAIRCDDLTRLHVELGGATRYADLDSLLDGAWHRVPTVARRLNMDAAALEATLDLYVRALLATGHAHDSDRLGTALGLVPTH